MPTKQKAVPVSTFARGGNATLKKYGKKHFAALAKKRWAKAKKPSKSQARRVAVSKGKR